MRMLIALVLTLFATSAMAQTQLGPTSTTVAVTNVASMAAIPANPTRRAVTICNGDGALTINFTFGTTVTPTATVGQKLLANSGANINCYTTPASITSGVGGQINMIASGAGPAQVTVIEY